MIEVEEGAVTEDDLSAAIGGPHDVAFDKQHRRVGALGDPVVNHVHAAFDEGNVSGRVNGGCR